MEPLHIPDAASVEERLAVLAGFAERAQTDPTIRQLANSLRGASQRITAEHILARVQSVPFVPDPSGEWFSPPLYTLAHGGDCDDLDALLAALALAAGIEARIAYIPFPEEAQDHYSAQLLIDGTWQWAEPTVRYAQLGDAPTADLVARVNARRRAAQPSAEIVIGPLPPPDLPHAVKVVWALTRRKGIAE